MFVQWGALLAGCVGYQSQRSGAHKCTHNYQQMQRVVFPEVNAGWGHVDEVGLTGLWLCWPCTRRYFADLQWGTQSPVPFLAHGLGHVDEVR